jgi:flavin-dependent dehydrogenase
MREDDQDLKKVAIWNYFRGAFRSPGKQGGSTIILHTRDKESWFWFIPLRDDMTSIGVVADNDYLVKGRGSPEQIFAEELELCPVLAGWLSDAEPADRFRVAKEFSYRTGQQAGDGWVLVGDAFGFIDPIYSSGVYFALKTGILAADAIIEGLANDDLSASQLGSWITEFESGSIWIRKLVGAFYSNEFSFGQFLKDFPDHQGNLTDLLIGRIFYDGAGKIFDDLDVALEAARKPGSKQ